MTEVTASGKICHHCGEPVPRGCELTVVIDDLEQPMCCVGCQAVAMFLNQADQGVFYRYREGHRPAGPAPAPNQQWDHLDSRDVFNTVTRSGDEPGQYRITIHVDGMYCSACGWLIQKTLKTRQGVSGLQINAVNHRIQVWFDPKQVKLSEIFELISSLGYQPSAQQYAHQASQDERGRQLKRIVVAGFGMMFIMTLAVPLYQPQTFSVSPHIQRFFLMISLLVATVVYFYSGRGFISNAIRDLKNHHLGMDVPVALSISLAYFVSIYLSFKQQGHVYFDSMAMFIFLLLLGRYVESQVRHRGMDVRESLSALVPVSATRVLPGSESETVPLASVSKGDLLRVSAGAVIPCDGQIKAGTGQVNEAILTGESRWLDKQVGDKVYAGSALVHGELEIVTTTANDESFLARLADLMELAQSQKPRSILLVDQVASYFVAIVLILAAITAFWYGANQPNQLMTALLAVLIATCPCALSLATPTALTAAGVHLMRKGVLVNNVEAISALSDIRHWCFDKTGTLTNERFELVQTWQLQNQQGLPDITRSLQQVSDHPAASAFAVGDLLPVKDAKSHAGKGVSGEIAGQAWLMGSQAWLASEGVFVDENNELGAQNTLIYLACGSDLVAVFALASQARDGASALIESLHKQGISSSILSGDQDQTVQHWGRLLGIEHRVGGLQAQDKINEIKSIQAQQPCVMVGDGVNDAPVLSQADVSISLKQGAHLAHAASDLIVLGQSLKPLSAARITSAKTQRVIRQNLAWSLIYNFSVTPVAMLGLLAPWMAAIGMSLSSLLVVMNSRRLL